MPNLAYPRMTRALACVTPSGNVVVERVTQLILRDYPEVSGHFSRVGVVGVSDVAENDYDWADYGRAAALLGHLKPDAIVWNGSKGGSVGFTKERHLVERLAQESGCPATTSSLVIDEALRRRNVKRIGLVTPYRPHYQAVIVETWRAQGFDCVAERGLDIADNLAYAAVPLDRIVAMCREVGAARPDALLIYCTNFPGAAVVAVVEAELGIPVLDATSAAVWGGLKLMGLDTQRAAAWGRLFAEG